MRPAHEPVGLQTIISGTLCQQGAAALFARLSKSARDRWIVTQFDTGYRAAYPADDMFP